MYFQFVVLQTYMHSSLFGQDMHFLPEASSMSLLSGNSKGSDETEPLLVADVISTLFLCAG